MGRPGLDTAIAAIATRLTRHLDRASPTAPVEPQPPKPVWNSLEAAKIAVGIVTSLAVGYLGYVVTTANTDRQFSYEKSLRDDAAARDKQVREEAARRDAAVRKEARDHQDKLAKDARDSDATARREAAAAAQEMSRETFVRELELKQRSDIRDAAIRAEARSEARLSKIHDRRIKAWEELGPAAAKMVDAAGDAIMQGDEPGRRRTLHKVYSDSRSEFYRLVGLNSAYFSKEFRLKATVLMVHALSVDILILDNRSSSEMKAQHDKLLDLNSDFTTQVEKELRLEGE